MFVFLANSDSNAWTSHEGYNRCSNPLRCWCSSTSRRYGTYQGIRWCTSLPGLTTAFLWQYLKSCCNVYKIYPSLVWLVLGFLVVRIFHCSVWVSTKKGFALGLKIFCYRRHFYDHYCDYSRIWATFELRNFTCKWGKTLPTSR